MGTGFGQLGMSAEQTRSIGNYAFNADQVQNFLDARLFGVPLSAAISQPKSEWVAFSADGVIDFTRNHIIYLVIPLVIISSIATHMNSRASVARQGAAALENPQTAIMNKLALYVFPLGILVSGAFFPVAILLYWVSNNLWTYGQQHIVFNRIEKEDAEKKAAKQEKLKANAPKPGARPDRAKKKAEPTTAHAADANGSAVNGNGTGTNGNGSSPNLSKSNGKAAGGSAVNGSASNGSGSNGSGGGSKAGAGAKPRPGQKPTSTQQRRRKRR